MQQKDVVVYKQVKRDKLKCDKERKIFLFPSFAFQALVIEK